MAVKKLYADLKVEAVARKLLQHYTVEEIARLIGMSVSEARELCESDVVKQKVNLFREKMLAMSGRLSDSFDEARQLGIERLTVILQEGKDSDAIRAAEMIMDRHPDGATTKKTQHTRQTTTNHITASSIKQIKEIAASIDVQAEEVGEIDV